MGHNDIPPEEEQYLRMRAKHLAYDPGEPEEVESIYRSLVREWRLEQDVEEALSRYTPKPWLPCDPDGEAIIARHEAEREWVGRFESQLISERGVVDPGAHDVLSQLLEGLVGDGSYRTPILRRPIGYDLYKSIVDGALYEHFEALYRVYTEEISVEAAAYDALLGRFGECSRGFEDPRLADRVEATVRRTHSLIEDDGVTPDDLAWIGGVWRMELTNRLCEFAVYEALYHSLDEFESGRLLLRRARASRVGYTVTTGKAKVTLTQARHALRTLEVLQKMSKPLQTYSEVEVKLDFNQGSDEPTGEGIRKGATRALEGLGEVPEAQTLLELLTKHEGLFYAKVKGHESA